MPDSPLHKLREPVTAPPVQVGEVPYVELDVTSNFSFLHGASHPDEYVAAAAAMGYRAIAITDRNTLAGIVRAHVAAREAKLKLIIGSRLSLSCGTELLVWCQNRVGYANLCRLLTLGKSRVGKGEFQLSVEEFLDHSDGFLVGLVDWPQRRGGAEGIADCRLPIADGRAFNGQSEIGNRKFVPSASLRLCGQSSVEELTLRLRDRLSLVVSLTYGQDNPTHLEQMRRLSCEMGVPLVATNHVHYHDRSRRLLQDVLVCVREKTTIDQAGYRLFPNAERYLKEPGQMHRLFSDSPEAIARANWIADQCTFSLDELRYEYPHEIVPDGYTTLEYLNQITWDGANARYPDGVPEKVRQKIADELRLIAQLKYEPYFLTVYDVVKFARSRGILCQGRGSAANSVVCYCIGVTSVDPMQIDLLFERFISAARNEPPDIDVDFEHERREEVIQYIYQKYGRDRAGMCAEIISYRGRSAIRDVGKALGLSLDMVDQMARKLSWWDRGVLNEKQLREAGLDPNDANVRRIVTIAKELLGFPRHLGQHVGGMVMTHTPLCEMVPIENAAMPDRTVIEWNKDDIDAAGLLKVDCLALGMLTCISKAFSLLEQLDSPQRRGGAERNAEEEFATDGALIDTDCFSESIGANLCASVANSVSELPSAPPRLCGESKPKRYELHTVPREDPVVYDMICRADTIGVFQIESRAQMSMLPRLRPRCFYDLVIEVAIVRPGPIQGNMVHPYLRRRSGEEAVTYPSEALRAVLHKTLGVPLFQEQAMKIAMVGAGFSGEEADRLRRAMSAWRRSSKLLEFQKKIVDGMLKNGYELKFAEQCFEQIKGFGEYGFPESHSASFALLVYVSSYLKCHHPAAFAAALINSQPMGFYAPAQIIRDAREHGVEVLPADVNESEWDCILSPPPLEGGGRGRGISTGASNLRASSHTPPYPPPQGGREPAIRLGLRMIRGLKREDADRIVEARKAGRFESVDELHKRSGIRKSVIERLAEADAFSSIDRKRRIALWEGLKLTDEQMPLFAMRDEETKRRSDEVSASTSSLNLSVSSSLLPAMPLGQEVMTDYSTTGLSLKAHPLSLIRTTLSDQKIITAKQLKEMARGRWVRVAGLVLIRQRPGTASGIVFVTLEDETGIVNLIIRPDIFDRYQPVARHAALMQAEGYVERQGEVIHVLAKRLFDRSELIRGYAFTSRDFH